MHRNDKSKFLLYIEPSKEEKLKEPINDEITQLMEMAYSKSICGAANYSTTEGEERFQKDNGWR